MGFNTVVLVLNDFMHELEKSPKSLTWAITHPPQSEAELDRWWQTVHHVADKNEEKRINRSAVKVMPTFHADDNHILIAGRNQLLRETNVRYEKLENGKLLATVRVPDWWKEY